MTVRRTIWRTLDARRRWDARQAEARDVWMTITRGGTIGIVDEWTTDTSACFESSTIKGRKAFMDATAK